ncbi:hypothetical protein B0919_08075 [Hymenobacter sp. CRA2]|nr:hypothetical protein B0919_08075 [Hymenobacter sp. CRA2]
MGGLAAQAQEACMLVPLPLAQRTAAATLVVEARVTAQQVVENAGGNIFTLNRLEVYKVFSGQLPAGVQVTEPGGTLGLRREVVSATANLAVGQQGLFLLEPDPVGPDRSAFRLVAGPQGLIRYDTGDRTAADPFGKYRSIENELYPAVERATGRAGRQLKANASLDAAPVAARANAPVINGFLPASLPAGTGAVLTINGSGFGATRGAGRVEFPNADAGGSSYIAANSTDYVLWADTQIQVRVPSGAGSGAFRVTTDAAATTTSPSALAVVYAYSNIDTPPARARLVNDDGQGGYTLNYDADFAANTAARGAFERALNSWNAATRLPMRIGALATNSVISNDGTNIVRFDAGATLPTNVLGRTTSYYQGCIPGGSGPAFWKVSEIDFNFARPNAGSGGVNWNFGPQAPTSAQYDFESVALHEQGHAHQLGHIIRPTAVMHYAIANGQLARTLSADSDIPGSLAVIDFSLNSLNPCGEALIQLLNVVLPVELVGFAGRYESALPGVRLSWTTATETGSAYFAVQAADAPAEAAWQDVTRVPAAGNSTARRSYEALDSRPLAAGQTRYYRLRQADADGREYFSDAVAVTGAVALLELQTFPNPVADVLSVRGPATEQAGSLQLTLTDAAGRRVRELRLPATTTAVEVPVADLRNGLYLLQWRTAGGQVLRSRVLVQH